MIFNIKGLFIFSMMLMFLSVARMIHELPVTVIFLASVIATYLVVQDLIKFGTELEIKLNEKNGERKDALKFYKISKVLFDVLGVIFILGPIFWLIFFREEIFVYIERPETAIDFVSLMSLAMVLLTIAAKEVIFNLSEKGLTAKELELIDLLKKGRTNKEIQTELNISQSRITNLKKSIKSKGHSL